MAIAVEVSQIDTDAPRSTLALLKRAVEAALKHETVADASISVTLLNDARIRQMNRKYLEHDYVTDVIAFPLYEPGESPVGDVYIGYEQAERQALDADLDLTDELARLAIHGTLHVLGYDHAEDESRTQSEMWQVQEEILKEL
ncbi:MAG TPA: rRNA maturation RNase YbeY [Longimicrobiales bacterium]